MECIENSAEFSNTHVNVRLGNKNMNTQSIRDRNLWVALLLLALFLAGVVAVVWGKRLSRPLSDLQKLDVCEVVIRDHLIPSSGVPPTNALHLSVFHADPSPALLSRFAGHRRILPASAAQPGSPRISIQSVTNDCQRECEVRAGYWIDPLVGADLVFKGTRTLSRDWTFEIVDGIEY
jgi:hypothetical protein